MTKTCSICGQALSANPLSGPAHARKHRNEFCDRFGRRPRSYDEVRELFNGDLSAADAPIDQAALGEFE